MKKQILTAMLTFVLTICVLSTASAVVAAEPTKFTITPDKPTVRPGDTITYTVTMGAITDLAGMKLKLVIPRGLTFLGGEAASGIETTLNAASAEWTEETKVFLVGSCAWSGTEPLTLMTFRCKADEDASGEYAVTFADSFEVIDSREEDIPCDISDLGSAVTVNAPPASVLGIRSKPAVLTYTIGSALDPEGMELVIRKDGDWIGILPSDCRFGYDFGTPGKAKVSVTYVSADGEVFKNSFTVNVVPIPEVRQIVLATKPTKLVYAMGEGTRLDTEGLTVLAKLTDGTTKSLSASELTVTGFDPLQPGVQRLTVRYGSLTQTTSFSVIVNEGK